MHELRAARFFDVFEFNAPAQQWNCFLCNHPERAPGFMQEDHPLMEGQLKEKKNKWLIFRRWRTRYFTLSGAHLSYRESVSHLFYLNLVNATRSNWCYVVSLNRNRILMPRPSISIKFARSKLDGRVVASQRRLRFSPATRRTSSKPKTARTPRSGSNVCRSLWRRHTRAIVLHGPFRSISLWLNRNSDCGRPSDPDAWLRLPSPKIREAFCHIPFRLTLFQFK